MNSATSIRSVASVPGSSRGLPAHRALQLELVSERHTSEVILLAFIQQQCVGTQGRVSEKSHAARSLRNLPILSRHAACDGTAWQCEREMTDHGVQRQAAQRHTHNRYTSRARSDRRIDALGCWVTEAVPTTPCAGVGMGVAFGLDGGLYDRSPPPPGELLAPNREASDDVPCAAELNWKG